MMNKLYSTNKNRFIAYNIYKNNKKTTPYIIFLHGLMSDMNGIKSMWLEDYCRQREYNFIRFDNFGHGQSSGTFINETIGSWLNGLELILTELTNGHVILVGSSLGGWLALLASLKFPEKIVGLVCIAPAPDFTEEAIWQKLPPDKQEQMQLEGYLVVGGHNCKQKYPLSYQLISEARNHLLLNKDSIELNCPVHLIHGMLDNDIPYTISQRLLQKITTPNIVLKLIKDGDHRLSRPLDLEVITNSLSEIYNVTLKI